MHAKRNGMDRAVNKSVTLIVIAIFLGLLLGWQTFALSYASKDQKIFRFLASDPTIQELIAKLGMPEQVYPAGNLIPGLGWPSPKKAREHEAWVYSNITGKRFIVFVNRDQNRIEYVFASNS